MGRECRRVPATWVHPCGPGGQPTPLLDGYAEAPKSWKEGYAKWEAGEDPARAKYPREDGTPREFWEWHGSPPEIDEYMPEWPAEQRTHYQMYETCSEGTPISPVFATPEEVARWCANNGASAFGSMTATYDQWLATARGAWAPSMVMVSGKMMSGVEFAAKAD